jgi:hypothetical protein
LTSDDSLSAALDYGEQLAPTRRAWDWLDWLRGERSVDAERPAGRLLL